MTLNADSVRLMVGQEGRMTTRRQRKTDEIMQGCQRIYLVEVLPNINIWNDFNYSQYSVEVRKTSTDEL